MSDTNKSGGISFLGLLGVLFIALKLTGNIDWSWIWVLLPLWGGLALLFCILAVALVSYLAVSVVRHPR